MRFIFMSEGETPAGHTHEHRYRELIDEVLLAEDVGFDAFGTSEQHVAIGTATTSAPEVIYPYLMAKTSRIRFIHLVTLLPTRINHALRVAERLATEDILSNGRIELGVGRGNTTLALRAFEVSPSENKAQQLEGLEVIRRALHNDIFSFVGEHYKIPPRGLVPKAIQTPCPPIHMATGSPESVRAAAELGVGAIMGGFYLGFEFLENMLSIYDEALAGATHTYPLQAEKLAVVSGGMHCAETRDEARDLARTLTESVALSTDAYQRLSKLSSDYQYMGAVKDLDFHDERYMLEDSAGFIVGDPDDCIAQVQRFADLGVDSLVMRIDGLPHRELMKSIELFGKYVIPKFKNPGAVVRSSGEILDDIRAARPAHYAEVEAFEAAHNTPSVASSK
ncbi:LLM class flavin-dependent oxidoreductase [Rhodococcus fascians]|uniref:LLM class flavin-dependent oxidoreductase n=1 Tax=Rhodococcoides fascians TaxID=1828 RepID=UPI00195B6CEC|nr:LLM class flavin-dependent oxidoreductase [Rhodococcus fascians]MBM7242547.1 LLM class flavin-dependent oxidoreductase [Rhodococcus fascians]MBY3811997.1 LLM class flavin-dependent oxidoreductase [Rhodococcus fascians]MBY3840695.1 LLM class flavin-dependent oxidoreductase [Rhodococcus fascians]MBY3848173.1 LLM class flavin-dependent oxidoreductase [Rhodococcus fascians]MBY3853294.1 LLM class flavin-dependent oxidoreductase [Rhodococcus fascians]